MASQLNLLLKWLVVTKLCWADAVGPLMALNANAPLAVINGASKEGR
jgi:hypothetical protein